MNNLIKLTFVLCLLLPVCVQGQAVTWQKWYDYNNRENAGEDVIQSLDGGYAVISNNYGGNYNSMLNKLNYSGNIEWQTLIDASVAGAGITSYAITQSKDSSFIISGDCGDSAFIIKTNNLGNIQWLKKYSRPEVNAAKFSDHILTNDGGIIACGDVFPFNAYVVRTDSVGLVIWDTVYDGITRKIAGSKDGNFYLISSAGLRKINPLGQTIWLTPYPSFMNSIIIDTLGFVYTAGGTNSVYLFKYDSSGVLLWNKYYNIMHCHSMCLSKDNNILIAATFNTLIQTDIAALKTNLNGDLIFNKRVESIIGNWFKIPYSVNFTSDYGFIFTGQTDYPGFPFNDNIIVVKTDSVCYAPLIVGINNLNININNNFILDQNYPNPFNPSTIINYEIPSSGIVSIKVYTIDGEEIATLINEFQFKAKYSITFNADDFNLPSGIYIYQLQSRENIKYKKMIYLK